jgi:hypothetical protein
MDDGALFPHGFEPDLRGVVADLPVVVRGAWVPGPRAEWVGLASAPEPLVAVALLARGGAVRWARTDKSARDAAELPVRLLLLPYPDGRHVQVNWAVGGAWVADRHPVPSPGYRPSVPPAAAAHTGRPVVLAAFDGPDPLRLGALFLPRRDARFVRKGIWRLRPALAASLPPPVARFLTFGRSGRLDP